MGTFVKFLVIVAFFRFVWDTIEASFQEGLGRGAILTTHSMEEADALCSRVGIMVKVCNYLHMFKIKIIHTLIMGIMVKVWNYLYMFQDQDYLHLHQGRVALPWIHSTSEEQVWSGISTGGNILKDFLIDQLTIAFKYFVHR